MLDVRQKKKMFETLPIVGVFLYHITE